MTQIKTLAEILAEMGHTPVSAKTADSQKPSAKIANTSDFLAKNPSKASSIKSSKRGKNPNICDDSQADFDNDIVKSHLQDTLPDDFSNDWQNNVSHAKTARKARKQRKDLPIVSQVESRLSDANQGKYSEAITDKLAAALKDTAIEPLAVNDRATNYMRWLAFYYLSRRELSQHQLRQKLLAKECDAEAVEALLVEFAEKNYQSDERCAHMLIRESVRKSRGKQHIRQALKDAKLTLSYSLDELIANAGIDEMADGTILENQQNEQVDWLLLAVEARCKKYGNHIPTDPKEKARQLRFLQYRGFEIQICFDALKYCPEDLLAQD